MGRLEPIGIVIPCRPTRIDCSRLVDLLESIVYFEVSADVVVVVVTDGAVSNLRGLCTMPRGLEVVWLSNPREGQGYGAGGGLTTGILEAIRFLWSAPRNLGCVIKMDTDALVIGPFREKTLKYFATHRQAGVIGAAGLTCRREWSQYGEDLQEDSPFVRLYRAVPEYLWDDLARLDNRTVHTCKSYYSLEATPWPRSVSSEQPEIADQPNFISSQTIMTLAIIHPLVIKAMAQGYGKKIYCAGGAYAISREMALRLKESGCSDNNILWRNLHLGEDVIMGMLTYAMGLRVEDFSLPGQPFGIQAKGLPYQPEELFMKGYSLIHSVKRPQHCSEAQLRKLFRSRRIA